MLRLQPAKDNLHHSSHFEETVAGSQVLTTSPFLCWYMGDEPSLVGQGTLGDSALQDRKCKASLAPPCSCWRKCKMRAKGRALMSAWHKSRFPDVSIFVYRILAPSAYCMPAFSDCASPALLAFPPPCISFTKPDATCSSPSEGKPHIWGDNCSLQIYSQSQENSPLQKGDFSTLGIPMPKCLSRLSCLHFSAELITLLESAAVVLVEAVE